MAAPLDSYPPGYDIRALRDGLAVIRLHSSGFGGEPISRGFGCLAAAEHWLEEHAAALDDEERAGVEIASSRASSSAAPLADNLVTHDTGPRDRRATEANAVAAARFIATPGPADEAEAERGLIAAASRRGHLILTLLDGSAQ